MRPTPHLLFALCFGACLDPEAPGALVPETVIEDPTLPRLEVNRTLLHAETFGASAAPTVVVLHGGPGGDYRSLLPLQALAADGYQVVFWDQRGAGLSQRHPAKVFSYKVYLEDLRLLIEKTVAPGQVFVLLGQSWGAMYATWFINQYGDYNGRLRGAVLTEPGAFTKPQLDEFIEKLMKSVELTGKQLNDATWSRQFISAHDHERADYLAMLMAYRAAPSERQDPNNPSPAWRQGAVVNASLLKLTDEQPFDWTTHLGAFATKVLFLRGSLNTVATLEHQKALAASYPQAEIVTIEGVGHAVIWERSQEYLSHVRAYFQSIGFIGGFAGEAQ